MTLNEKENLLIKRAEEVVKNSKRLKQKKIGDVECALITRESNIFVGVSIDFYGSLGGCSERGAILSMMAYGETEIDTIVAVCKGKILTPCGVCRETILQANRKNINTNVIISKEKSVKLKELLLHQWQEISGDW